uniref:Uncharacterized protein n=1 Tax=Anguilla anguilla TaxID=7936 RepID=A0A0E9UI56_ANGAN
MSNIPFSMARYLQNVSTD